MKVVRLHGLGDLQLHSEPIPEPGPEETLIQVTAVGICGSDLHWFAEGGIGASRLERPLVLGHEFAAVIAEGERKGERVAVDPAIPCHQCEFCLEGNPNFCTNIFFAGQAEDDGALREYMAWPTRCLFPIPDDFTAADGAVLEPLGVAIHAMDLGKVKPGMTVGIFGCGPIGLLTLQMARAAGASRIIATDRLPHRLEAARAYGATDVYPVADGQEREGILVDTKGRGVDVAFEAAGDNDAVETAIECSKRGGCVVQIGIPSDDRVSFSASLSRRRGLTIKIARRMKHVYPRAITLVQNGQVDVRSMVTHCFPLAESSRAFALAERREGLKIVIEPSA